MAKKKFPFEMEIPIEILFVFRSQPEYDYSILEKWPREIFKDRLFEILASYGHGRLRLVAHYLSLMCHQLHPGCPCDAVCCCTTIELETA